MLIEQLENDMHNTHNARTHTHTHASNTTANKGGIMPDANTHLTQCLRQPQGRRLHVQLTTHIQLNAQVLVGKMAKILGG